MRNSKTYAGFKTFNGIVLVVLGTFIIVQMIRTAGFRFEAFSGYVLGAAMIALGMYRIIGFARSRR